MIPGNFDLTGDYAIYQGDDYILNIRLGNDDGSWRDLTGATVKSQIRTRFSTAADLIAEFTATIAPDQVADTGRVTLSLSDTVTEAITAEAGVWDVQVEQNGVIETFLRGKVAVLLESTRNA